MTNRVDPSLASARPWWILAALVLLFAVAFAGAAANYVRHYAISPSSVVGIYCSFVFEVTLVIAPGLGEIRERIRHGLARRAGWAALPIACCTPYLIYAAGTGDWRWDAIARLLAVALAVLLPYVLVPVRDPARFAWQDAVVAVALIVAVLSRFLHGIWNVPVNLDFFARLFLVTVGVWCWTFVRPVPALGYELRLSWKVLRAAAANFIYFAVVGIPLSFALRFTAWHPRWHGAGTFCLDYLEILLFVALLEETFFRGFLQSLLAKSFHSWWKGQALVACLFGLFHILHAPFPNWRYVLLATGAGWFYGSAFRQGGSLLASSLVHAMVDTVWRSFLTR